MNDLKVIFVYKRFGQGGYYIDCASAALAQQGIHVTIEPKITYANFWKAGCNTIFHLHFPEELYKSESTLRLLKNAVKNVVLLLLLKTRGARIVWTLHDDIPHEPIK